MKKLCLMSCALALATLVSFWVGGLSREYATVEGQARGKVYPKVEIYLTIAGIEEPLPTGVKGLGASCDVLEVVDPQTKHIRKRPGRVKYGDITLKRGVINGAKYNSALYEWFDDVKLGDFAKKNGEIIMREFSSEREIARYELFEAWPCKWKGVSAPNADAAFPYEQFDIVAQKVSSTNR